MGRSITRVLGVAGAAGLLLATTACGGKGFDDASAPAQQQAGPAKLTVLIASSSAAEQHAVEQAATAWATRTGSTVEVVAANDMAQQLSQGFAAGSPPDVFMADASKFAGYAQNMLPYGDSLPYKDDIYPSLRQTFTLDDKLYCAPKDFSTLALVINNELWTRAGLTDQDVPTTWEQLRAVAQKLTTGEQTGLVFASEHNRVNAFLVQAGGWVLDDKQTTATADTPQNLQALQYVRDLLASGAAKFPKQIGAGDSIEALGKGKAAMVVEGNWIVGAMRNDYPDVKYRAVPLPAGPAGAGTLSFTQCWGIAAQSHYQEQAKDLVNAFMDPQQQLTFAETFGVMPARQSVREQYQQRFPDQAAFLQGAEHAHGPVTPTAMDAVMADFDAQLQQLPDADPKRILEQLQRNASAALGAR
ncbi:sugar ABC transporter substrate-binding protein [Goodfellowiella coeruleoviolacea]|uniref:Carbohydrate ABC transporter substrate-binding protein, CUT1 family (TC 3.A.1.1.-) n=1 Tax=Goodfellowiella coeruleoviolacea TaxID=334858 RepID=A0AAE3GGS3_9PSEU|nr:extracellular solute-binding protein [Goodfellowiella coeruleoviolacea]MCP2167403.1 carbohydrate ABC transporter substrate-binding protein, CUT1 family (TC 3.A.1.1.-) [Goodfellowiella coeruleoviolacea]